MKLILTNGYPYPYPNGLTPDLEDALSNAAPSIRLELAGVTHFEWLHTVTVKFVDDNAESSARVSTGWSDWSPGVLEAQTSSGDGYDHPAIIVGDVAYCGFQLRADA